MLHLQALSTFIVSYPLQILVCIVAYMAIGFVWYGPLFGKIWAKAAGMEKMKKADMQKIMVPAMATSILTGFVFTVVLGRGMQILQISSWVDPLIICLILWFPFTAMVMAQGYIYTHRPLRMWAIDAGYIVVGLWVISLILLKTVL